MYFGLIFEYNLLQYVSQLAGLIPRLQRTKEKQSETFDSDDDFEDDASQSPFDRRTNFIHEISNSDGDEQVPDSPIKDKKTFIYKNTKKESSPSPNPSSKSLQSLSEKSSFSLAHAVLLQDIEELLDQRANYLLFEDNFTPTLAKIVKRDHGAYSFARLRSVCARFENAQAMKQHDAKSRSTSAYFTKMVDRKISDDDARAFAFAIAFYSGSQSETINQGVALIIRTTCAEDIINGTHEEIGEDAAIIMFYLARALSHITFYWGTVTRRVQLTPEEVKDYKPGALITWIQFSSSMKGEQAPKGFQNRNTQFTIQSLTGRSIQYFSNFPEEDEVLFLPHSSLLVKSVDYINSVHYISMEQVELGLCKYSVLWVDDNIFDENWENKRHMEKASTAGIEVNVHFIPKSTTKSALAFLKSPFGERLKHNETFRIITGMNRHNEEPSDNAGARLLARAREMGFNSRCLVFTGNAADADRKVKQLIIDVKQRENIEITQSVNILEQFVNFNMSDSLKVSQASKSFCTPS
ncbi:unnamed protein product [Rotaria socialis]|uniref:NAD(P)(+)--arginine ADP-ribosyltransferase n=1 Tax=Rotaria socialis TaxID=392032 RepID=A0A820CLT1_9BILA|nr:unnamed protein product [Rotaria socialis]CAF4223109.1 unnamed protein product [Rotaria socialis]CAF4231671.1 unnamed protein product [Rotaria socialis]CAF4431145.1 unnamed protein product [Rotaria socialis]